MYTSSRIVQFKNMSAMAQGLPICQSIMSLMKEFVGNDVGLYTATLGGNPVRVLFVTRAENIATLSDGMDRAAQNTKFRELVSQLGQYVEGTHTQDQVWKKIG